MTVTWLDITSVIFYTTSRVNDCIYTSNFSMLRYSRLRFVMCTLTCNFWHPRMNVNKCLYITANHGRTSFLVNKVTIWCLFSTSSSLLSYILQLCRVHLLHMMVRLTGYLRSNGFHSKKTNSIPSVRDGERSCEEFFAWKEGLVHHLHVAKVNFNQ